MKKMLRVILKIVVGLIIILGIIIGGFLLYFDQSVEMSEKEEFLDTQLYTWNRIPLGQPAACSDGSEYSIFTRKGNSYKVIIYFSGGGVCWDDTSCTEPFSLFNWDGYYFPDIRPKLLASVLGGITDIEREDNAFKDWNLVYIPYCTGDFHIGNAVNSYKDKNGNSVEVTHHGQANMIEAFNWIFRHFHTPEKILIAGESAGGFGNIFWTLAIGKNYPNVPIYQLSDCSWLDSKEWPQAVKLWNANTEKVFGYNVDEDIYGNALLHTAKALEGRNITFLQTASVMDETILRFYEKINDLDPSDLQYQKTWSQNMLQAMARYDDSLYNYYYYLTDWGKDENGLTPHTFMANERFYQCEEEGDSLQQWLKRVVIEDAPYSVGEELLSK